MKRREFISSAVLAGAGSVLPASTGSARSGAGAHASSASPTESCSQLLHRDYISCHDGLEYFVLGNGLIQVVLQTASTADAGTHCGLFVMSPEHFSRKASSFLYHPERGVENTRLSVTVGDRTFFARSENSTAQWQFTSEEDPLIRIQWDADSVRVEERLDTPAGLPVLRRRVRFKNTGTVPTRLRATALLYPNLMLFDEYSVDRGAKTLSASGFGRLHLSSNDTASGVGDRHLFFDFGLVEPGGERQCELVLRYDTPDAPVVKAKERRPAALRAEVSFGPAHEDLRRMFLTAQAGMRAAVARSGKMDGSIWQYNLEWVRDQSMVAEASAFCGMTDMNEHDVAPAILERILTRSVDRDGGTVESSRTRTPGMMELDQNGELLHALRAHWLWSGDETLLRRHWSTARSVGSYLLSHGFADPDSGLLKNTREYWERDAHFGVREGFENTYQLWSILGFEALGDMAEHVMHDDADARYWRAAASRMRASYLGHPRHALIEQGVLIKRRLPDGGVQRLLEVPDRNTMPRGMPLAMETENRCEPDASCALPVVYGLVDPAGPVARATLDVLESLWNLRWQGGGYARYHTSSEPDSPGPWPFPSLMVARANLEAGNHERVWRVLRWLLAIPGGRGGGWLEFYGTRPTPPLPPVGIVVWTWAELVALVIEGIFGIRPRPREILLAPHLLSGIDEARASVAIRGKRMTVDLRRTTGQEKALLGGKQIDAENGIFRIPYPDTDTRIECHVH